ncbi:MAG: NAD-dependent epimerase/dehydratase family protein [Candidatus Kerfeldbacteria bacterium]|nr:NAD-dependent epimerase/dehydratase family protein [Candidatus Kerfeldbacteria bacterium]
MPKILITGSAGQVGSALLPALIHKYGAENIVITIHKTTAVASPCATETLDITNQDAIRAILQKHQIDTIYHLAGMLSAASEKNPDLAWEVNFSSLKNILDLARELKIKRIFWPSSIAAFGPNTPHDHTPQSTILEPSTLYGVAKVSGELLCNYYYKKFNVDVRSVRYPGLISHAAPPADGTTEYSIAMFYAALKKEPFSCFLRADSALPMLYMDDAIKGTIDLMEADAAALSTHMSYNISGFSFTPAELVTEIKKHIPGFAVTYAPDFHQAIADSWPRSIDDSLARHDWGWQPHFTLETMVADMIKQLRVKLNIPAE